MTTQSKPPRNFTISNIAGGDYRAFRLDANGQLSDNALTHIRRLGYGGPLFGGPAAERADKAWRRV